MTGAAVSRSYFGTIWKLRHFWSSLVCNDIISRYRRSFLGLGWSLLRPISMTAVFCFVFGGLFNQPTAEYAPYLMLGVAVWQFIFESMLVGCNCFVNSAPYIRQQRVPLALFSLRTVLGSGFHFLIALALAIALAVFFRGLPNPAAALAIIPSLALIFVFCWAAATVLGLIQAHFPDTSQLLEIAMQILFYLTPIVYKTSSFPDRRKFLYVLEWNPFYSLLELVRTPILEGTLPSAKNIALAAAFTAATVLLAWVLLRKMERRLVFWL
jgi:lipopolysaccharide transport system permease protein